MSIILELSREEELLLEHAADAAGSRDVASYIRQTVLAALSALNEVQDQDTLTFLRDEGRNAVQASQQDLLARGIAYVMSTPRIPDSSVTTLMALRKSSLS